MSAALFDPDDTSTIGSRLVSALAQRVGSLSLLSGPDRLGGGLDTYVYGFPPAGEGAAGEWAKPLILRVYPSPDQGPKAEREFAVQRFVSGLRFPAPRPMLVEPNASIVGLPFMVMQRVPGTPVLDCFKNPFLIPRMLTLLADTHARLHALPASGWPLPHDGPLVERLLPRTVDLVERFDLRGPRKGLEWLRANMDVVSKEDVSVCHTDFHFLNVLLDRHGRVSVVDWTDADVGDRHSDLARTTALFWLAPPLARSAVERTVLTWIRGYVSRGTCGGTSGTCLWTGSGCATGRPFMRRMPGHRCLA